MAHVALLLALSGSCAARLAVRVVAPRTSCTQCLSKTVPVPFRPLDQQEIVNKLDAVPVFSVVNEEREMFPERAKDNELCCCFYLDLKAAQLKLSELQAANPRLPLSLAVTPLGTAYALSEWLPAVAPSPPAAPARRGLVESFRDTDNNEEDGVFHASSEEENRIDVELRILGHELEINAVSEILEQSPTPALVRPRNRVAGPVPLFGSDELRFMTRAGFASQSGKGSDDRNVETLTPLFFCRADFRAAWLASGGTDDTLPAVQVSDVRTLVWQMECESAFDWRQVVLVAPQESIDYAVEVEEKREAAGLPPPQMPRPMRRSEVQAAIFPADSGVIRDRA